MPQPEPSPYVAPAAEVLTVLHRPDGDKTRCGRPMLPEELWMPIDGRDGDSLCTGCLLPGSVRPAAEDVEVTLW